MLLFSDTFLSSWRNLPFTLVSMSISISPQQLLSRTRSRNDTENCPFRPPLCCSFWVLLPQFSAHYALFATTSFTLLYFYLPLISFPPQKCIEIAVNSGHCNNGWLPAAIWMAKIDVMVAVSITKQEGN